MTPQQFIAKWQRANLSERSAAQSHFLDLCKLLGQREPVEADPDGTSYTFERGVHKIGGGTGWADVWMKGHFGWEYKKKRRNLAEAYEQLLRYREDLENPPLLVVCDLDRFEIHTNFTNTVKQVYAFGVDSLGEPANLDVLRKVFTSPEALRPGQTTADVTQKVAERFGKLADGMRDRKVPPERAAHFLMKLMFCMFAERIGLLQDRIFTKVLSGVRNDPKALARKLKSLFQAMADGGEFGADTILHFNGGLFADADVEELTPAEIEEVVHANDCDWSNVEPSIFGTLFERTLDPAKRSQIGAHYTSKEDILTLLEPVMMAPLRAEWEAVRARCDELWTKVQQAVRGKTAGKGAKGFRQSFEKLLRDFGHRLEEVKVLDPACGSGNFLYVAINLLLDLEKQVIAYGSMRDFSWFPHVRPSQLAGIEINPYAQQLAQVVIWIGYLQWMHHNGFKAPSDPVLEPIENIRRMDAILDLPESTPRKQVTDPSESTPRKQVSDPTLARAACSPDNAKEPEWPAADFIVGNPPFLGGKKLRSELGDEYLDQLYIIWSERLPGEADLCCYWFEKARKQLHDGRCKRAGLLATQGIRGRVNRQVLQRIKETGDIFFAESDRPWILEGANVHVSMVGFDAGHEKRKLLDGKPVTVINANLTSLTDITQAKRLPQNLGLSFMADIKVGEFDLPEQGAVALLSQANAHGCPNSDVVVPWWNGLDVTRRPRNMWIVDFGVDAPLELAARYELPFKHVEQRVKPLRAGNKMEKRKRLWWIHGDAAPRIRATCMPRARYLATAMVAKHRLFVWLSAPTLPDHQLIVFPRSDDYFFGVLHSRLHEVWARAQGTQVRERESGFRYTPTTCFETFPFPAPAPQQEAAIAAAAKELDTLRSNWLNPPEWTKQEVLEFPGSVSGPWARYVQEPDQRGIGTVRYPRLVPKDEDCAEQLKKRALTNLYNERPTWLDLAHKKLDAAVFAAYGWKAAMSDEEILASLLALNLERAEKK